MKKKKDLFRIEYFEKVLPSYVIGKADQDKEWCQNSLFIIAIGEHEAISLFDAIDEDFKFKSLISIASSDVSDSSKRLIL